MLLLQMGDAGGCSATQNFYLISADVLQNLFVGCEWGIVWDSLCD